MNKISKIVSVVGAGALLVGASVALTHSLDKSSTQIQIDKIVKDYETKLSVKPTEVSVPGPVQVITKEVPGPVQIKEVTVESKDLPVALDFIHDNLDKDITMDYILFETNAHIEAESYINDNMKSLLDDNNYFDNGELFGDYRKSEVTVSKIYDPVFSEQDYDKDSATLTFKVKVHAYADKDLKTDKYFTVIIPFEKKVLQENDISIEEYTN